MKPHHVQKPIKRSKIRQKLGKEYFCLKEQLRWLSRKEKLSKTKNEEPLPFQLMEHQSFLRRPLKDVEMYLQENKVTNLRLASNCISGVVIKPGETFSIWQMVGRPTKAKGYLEGMTLSNGKVTKGVGGGLCQLGNLIYWMAIHTPLTVKKRWRHSYDVFPDVNRKIPFGSGATLSYNYIDLQLKNETNEDFQLSVWLNETHLKGAVYSNQAPEFAYQIEERNHRFVQQWWGGYTRHNEIWRIRTNLVRQIVEEELITENHAVMMYNPLLE